ncbi:hypothetical protein [Rhizomicrobium electricum]|jgi:hypothetical protein|uniref:hypothetical protein n=1 Tax=Rhizomicrobium electricum TaxID=480070 RepID=UPI00141EAD38|nr:hypothetical protein [Rhizomicrobium electricum]NIJ49709.1 hypothetical protein [Rhizomicrobium electricum]
MLDSAAASVRPDRKSPDNVRDEISLAGKAAAHPWSMAGSSKQSPTHIINGVAYSQDRSYIDSLISFLVIARAYGCLRDPSGPLQ